MEAYGQTNGYYRIIVCGAKVQFRDVFCSRLTTVPRRNEETSTMDECEKRVIFLISSKTKEERYFRGPRLLCLFDPKGDTFCYVSGNLTDAAS